MERIKNLETCLVLALASIVLYLIFGIRNFLIIGLVIGVVGVFFDSIASKINWGWMSLSKGLGFVVSKVLLSGIFFLFLTPIAFLYRFSNRKKNILQLKKDDKTYWIKRDKMFVKEDFNKMW